MWCYTIHAEHSRAVLVNLVNYTYRLAFLKHFISYYSPAKKSSMILYKRSHHQLGLRRKWEPTEKDPILQTESGISKTWALMNSLWNISFARSIKITRFTSCVLVLSCLVTFILNLNLSQGNKTEIFSKERPDISSTPNIRLNVCKVQMRTDCRRRQKRKRW